MSQLLRCPECGAAHADGRKLGGNGAGGEQQTSSQAAMGTSFARVLNGTPWKLKPLAPPRYRDDVVPFD